MNFGARIKSYFRNIGYFRVFVAVELILTAVFLTLCLLWNGYPFYKVMLNFSNRYTDYFIHLSVASAPLGTNIYEFTDLACFPPLAYLMYGFLARISGYHAENPGSKDSAAIDFGHNMTVFILYNIFCIVLMVYAVSLYFKKKGFVNQVLFPALIVFSYPVAFTAIQRGNSVLLVAPLLAIALAWKDDKSKVKRELALVLIAVCAGLKIYPAVFGLLYLKEKRWGETLRLIIYGIVLFFAPFAFFGGIEALKTFFNIIFSLYGTVNDFSISGVTKAAVQNLFGSKTPLFCTLVQQLYLVFSLIAFFMVKTKRAEILILCCLITIYISSNWMYTCIYLLPAMLMFFAEHDGEPIRFRWGSIPDYLAFIMFILTFSRPFIFGSLFVYQEITITISLYLIVTICVFIYRKWMKPILEQ